MATEVYSITIAGSEATMRALQALDQQSTKAAEKANTAVAEGAEKTGKWQAKVQALGGQFGQLGQNIGAMGGTAEATFARVVGGAAGLANAIGSIGGGGIVAAVAGVSLAVKLLRDAWGAEEAAAKAAAEERKKALEVEAEHLERIERAIRAEMALKTEAGAQEAGIHAERMARRAQEMLADVDRARGLRDQAAAEYDSRLKRSRDAGLIGAQLEGAMFDHGQHLLKTEKHFIDATEAQQAAAGEASIALQKAVDSTITANAIVAVGDRQKKINTEKEKAIADEEAQQQRANDAFLNMELKRDAAEEAQQQRANDAFDSLMAKKDRELEAINKLAAAEKKREDAAAKAMVAAALGAQMNAVYAQQAMLTGAAVGFLTSQMEWMGTVNRENYRDLLEITDNTVAAWVAQLQAALASIAKQAFAQGALETAAIPKEIAAGLASIAVDDAKGAAAHFASAGVHAMSAQAYAAIGGGSAVGAVGVGAVRGDGGLVGLTKQEKERKDMGARSSGGGPAPRQGVIDTGAGTGGGGVVLNFIYEAGSVNAGNDRALAATMGKGLKSLSRDGFAQRGAR